MTEVVTEVAGSNPKVRAYIFYLNEAGIQAATSNAFSVTWSKAPTDTSYAARLYEKRLPKQSDSRFAAEYYEFLFTQSDHDAGANRPSRAITWFRRRNAVMPNCILGTTVSPRGTDQQESSSDHSTADKLITTSGTPDRLGHERQSQPASYCRRRGAMHSAAATRGLFCATRRKR